MNRPTQKTIFLQAIEEQNLDERQSYLDSACGDDPSLRKAVESLLAAHHRPANPLDHSPLQKREQRDGGDNALDVTRASDPIVPTEHLGMTIDSYKLMEQIGEGGFGLVFVAQQEQPVKRKVALKIIKPGTGSKEVLARFDAERQAVAMMDHPNIAQVFDAGVTDDARPYFVMELVRGVPITEFCDRHAMTLRQRLELFQDVCAATHHAHQKGVVHRDLKPSNVMVTMHDDKAVVKVIDFGVAKAMGKNLTDQTIYTRFYAMVGTPLYMSPEQTAMSGLDVDTRSDIYSLGVLLYELLTGTTPFDRDRLDAAGYDEMRRIIREEEPPKPSTRLTTVQTRISRTIAEPTLVSVSASTRLPGGDRRESIPGDLDWIVMKAMEKDRSRRYESAAAMSADVKRFLCQEPIEARPPSRRYRLTQFARRHRVAFITGSLVAISLVLGTAASLYQASRAIDERNEKEIALRDAIEARLEVEGFADRLKTANVLLGDARTYEDAKQYAAADAAYSEAVDLVPNYYLVWVQRAILRARLHLWEEAAGDFSAAMQLEAPIDRGQWQGVSALFALTDREEEYGTLYSRLMTPTDDLSTALNWDSIRSCLIAPRNVEDARRMAAAAEALLSASDGPPGRRRGGPDRAPGPPEFGFVGPDRPWQGLGRPEPGRPEPGRPNLDGLGADPRGPKPGMGPGPERRGPGPALPGPALPGPALPGPGPPGPALRGPGPEGRRGPGFEGRLPRSVQQYLAGWANVRAGNPEKALDYLQLAAESRGPSNDLLHPLFAMAFHQTGRGDQALASLERADASLDRMILEMMEEPEQTRPWFDFAEAVLLRREATRLLTGDNERIDPRIRTAQVKMRAKLQGVSSDDIAPNTQAQDRFE
jgi:serine/threonine protein kinase